MINQLLKGRKKKLPYICCWLSKSKVLAQICQLLEAAWHVSSLSTMKNHCNLHWQTLTYFAWKALFVPRWSRSWQKHPTISARISESVSTSWNPAVWNPQQRNLLLWSTQSHKSSMQWLNYGLKEQYWFKLCAFTAFTSENH